MFNFILLCFFYFFCGLVVLYRLLQCPFLDLKGSNLLITGLPSFIKRSPDLDSQTHSILIDRQTPSLLVLISGEGKFEQLYRTSGKLKGQSNDPEWRLDKLCWRRGVESMFCAVLEVQKGLRIPTHWIDIQLQATVLCSGLCIKHLHFT